MGRAIVLCVARRVWQKTDRKDHLYTPDRKAVEPYDSSDGAI